MLLYNNSMYQNTHSQRTLVMFVGVVTLSYQRYTTVTEIITIIRRQNIADRLLQKDILHTATYCIFQSGYLNNLPSS